jgi:hypothetical protein
MVRIHVGQPILRFGNLPLRWAHDSAVSEFGVAPALCADYRAKGSRLHPIQTVAAILASGQLDRIPAVSKGRRGGIGFNVIDSHFTESL